MPQHLARPHVHPPHGGLFSALHAPKPAPRTPADAQRWQVFKDRLAVAAVLLLVLATMTVFVLYLVNQAPHFQAGELTAFATPAPAARAAATETASATTVGGLGRIPLILISTVVEMAIFVALGLYLRHDLRQKS